MLGTRHVSQTPEQLMLREAAADANPEFATLEGRAMQDVRDTLAFLAMGMRPQTVLGGLILNQYGPYDSTLVGDTGRDAIEIGVKGRVDPIGPNERGDTVQDVLEGLVSLGIAERAFDPGTVEAALVTDTDHRKLMNRPYYRLSTQHLPAVVQRGVDEAVQDRVAYDKYKTDRAAKQQARQERKEQRSIFKRRH